MSNTLLSKKIEYWKHQLLDLGKRNKMINYRETKRSVLKLTEPDFKDLYEKIVKNDNELTFKHSIDKDNDVRAYSLLSLLEEINNPLTVHIGDIDTDISMSERQATLKHMRSKARLSIEEQGTNILYVSFGFIEWCNGKGSKASIVKSPLVLVPVSLSLETINSPYVLKKYEDDIVVNPTLSYLLETEHGINLPQLLSDDEDIDSYLKRIEKLADENGWKVIREASIGLISFQKITMYKDIINNTDKLINHPLINAISNGIALPENSIGSNILHKSGDNIPVKTIYQVLNADSSQQEAIECSKHGLSFVMQGPPGTGKSQTITNIISEALAMGKTVLFVSEKMAALQVVYKRLAEAHLSEFCLPLHSYKVNKKDILEQIGANLDLNPIKVKDSAIAELDELQFERNGLNSYAVDLHKDVFPLNISCYEVYARLAELSVYPGVKFDMENIGDVDQSRLHLYVYKLTSFSEAVKNLNGCINDNPWKGITVNSVDDVYISKMLTELKLLSEKYSDLLKMAYDISADNKIPIELLINDLKKQVGLLGKCAAPENIPSEWVTAFELNSLKQTAHDNMAKKERQDQIRSDILHKYNASVFEIKAADIKNDLNNILNEINELSCISSAEEIVINYDLFSHKINTLIEDEKSYSEAVNRFNEICGTAFSNTFASSVVIVNIVNTLNDKNTILGKWFERSDFSELSNLLKAAEVIAEEILSHEKNIAEEWETEALTFDYSPVLLRYKTEYTNIFKLLKRQYHTDRKSILALNKGVGIKLDDDAAIKFLQELKKLDELNKQFLSHSDDMKLNFDILFNGKNTNWKLIENSIATAEHISELFGGNVPDKFARFISQNIGEEALSELNRISGICKEKYSVLSEKLPDLFIDGIVNSNIDDISSRTEKLAGKAAKLNSLVSAMLEKCTKEITYQNLRDDLDNIIEYKEICGYFEINSAKFSWEFGKMFSGPETDWAEIIDRIDIVSEIRSEAPPESFLVILTEDSEKKTKLKEITDKMQQIINEANGYIDWLDAQFEDKYNFGSMELQNALRRIEKSIDGIDLLEKWIDYKTIRSECFSIGLDSYITAVEKSNIFDDPVNTFLKGFYTLWLERFLSATPSLRNFKRRAHDNKIQNFRRLDSRQLEITQMRIREKLISGMPKDNHLLRAEDELSILKKELSKKSRIMPLRKLFRSIPNLLLRLKPCLMMSPMSVSYFLESDIYNFDLVIFDEASQIFPEDAIGAIFRSKQVIIAGDSKQLPPTGFFAAATNNSEDFDGNNDEDYEDIISDSILEEAAGTLPNKTLSWHYRSRHEGLISFSNREIYNNKLITFPCPVNKQADLGVEYIYVEKGFYEGGGKNCNMEEARKCVELVQEHINKNPGRSLGIIAFSEKQQTAIEDKINEFRIANPQYEGFFSEDKEEAFFVKNLENVQGDERDTIIFSICYAKDINGKMYMRFGPLGHQGGERRLNVAITRAKYNVKLVGSILPDDIDLNRTNSEGVRMLRAYIEFASGNAVTSGGGFKTKKSEENINDDFCCIVADFIAENGYEIRRNIGCSDYKIDIAVVDPENKSEYIAGIECDGYSYIQGETVRDRDHLRYSVLTGMGWKMYRVWSSAWIKNINSEKKALIDFLKKSVLSDPGLSEANVNTDNAFTAQAQFVEAVSVSEDTVSDNSDPYGFDIYTEAKYWEAECDRMGSEAERLVSYIIHIASVEQPLHMDLLYRRLAPALGNEKVTDVIRNIVDSVIRNFLNDKVYIDTEKFLWLLPQKINMPRIPGKLSTPRPMEYIATEEIAEAMLIIIKHSFGIGTDDLMAECALVFGFERRGPKIKSKLEAALNYLTVKNKIKIIEEKIQVIGGKYNG